MLTVTDPLSHVTTYAYDNLYRRTSITDALAGVTSFTFDAAGQLKTLTDPVENTTTWFYDDLGRVIEEKNQLDKSRYFQYDGVGNLTQRTDRNERVIQYVYDGLNRNTDEKWYDGESLVRTISFEFDAANQLLSADDPNANNLFTYDKLGRVTQEVQALTGFADTITLDQEFDALGNRTRAEMSYGTSATLATDYVYDGLSRMTKQTQYDSTTSDIAWKRVTFQYNAASQFAEINRFVGNSTTPIAVATTTYDYDGIGRLKDLLHFTDTTTWAGYDYEYDVASRITAIDSFVDGLTEYDYDNTNQLTDADHTGIPDESYDYDANGNRAMSGYVIGDNNQLESDGTYNYGYDDEGNRIWRTNISTGYVTTYTWDHRNRLTAVTEFDDEENILSSITYKYDAFDRWISRSYDADGPSGADAIDTFFAQDGDQVALEFEGETGTVDGDDLTHIYSSGPVVDQLLADESFGAEPLWALSDHLGTPRDLVAYDEIGEEVELRNHRIYDSYGNRTSQTSVVYRTGFGFTGRPFDERTEVANHRGRWYESATAIWISADPSGFAAGDANLSRYVINHPLSYVDPSGRSPAEVAAWNPTGDRDFQQLLSRINQLATDGGEVTSANLINYLTVLAFLLKNPLLYRGNITNGNFEYAEVSEELTADDLERALRRAAAELNKFLETEEKIRADQIPRPARHLDPVASRMKTLVEDLEYCDNKPAFWVDWVSGEARLRRAYRHWVGSFKIATKGRPGLWEVIGDLAFAMLVDPNSEGNVSAAFGGLFAIGSARSNPVILPNRPRAVATAPLNPGSSGRTNGGGVGQPTGTPSSGNQSGQTQSSLAPTRPAPTSESAETTPTTSVVQAQRVQHQQAGQVQPAAKSWDWTHIFLNHSATGAVAKQRNKPDQVFGQLSNDQIKAVVQRAWSTRKKIQTQIGPGPTGDEQCRMLYSGVDAESGYVVEFWYNLNTKTVETAYPVGITK